MILFIDTAQRDDSTLILKKGEKEYCRKFSSQNARQGDALYEIDALFKKAKAQPAALTGIVVVKGPGGFVALRTGIAIANAFGYALQIPIVGVEKKNASDAESVFAAGLKKLRRKKTFSPILPEYGKEANITSPKIY